VEARHVSPVLSHRLGHEATVGLLELLDRERVEWSDHVLNIGAERFERRLIEEVSNLRVDVIRELHASRAELSKWSLLFWISQFAAMIGVLSFMLRGHT
jgi:hypothetical protein